MSWLHLGSASFKWIRLSKLIRLISVFIISIFGIVHLQFLGSVGRPKQPWNYYAHRPYIDIDIATNEKHVKDPTRDIFYIDEFDDDKTHDQLNEMKTKLIKPVYARLKAGGNLRKITLHMQRWASENRTFETEAQRFIEYISNTQAKCEHLRSPGINSLLPRGRSQIDWPWNICQDNIDFDRNCVVYSFGPVIYRGSVEIDLARQGCEVHVFDPSLKDSIVYPTDLNIRTHSVTLDWRESLIKLSKPSRQSTNTRQSRRLTTIMQEFGHQKVDIIRADLQSSEWKVLENIITDGSIKGVRQIVFTIHLHWAGFEVRGSDPEIIRYWYSVLKAMEFNGFKLFNSFKDTEAPKLVLGKNFENSSCCFTLGWIKVDDR